MTKTGIAELKARLSEHLRAVRKGRERTVYDRSEPIASMLPLGVSHYWRPFTALPTFEGCPYN